MATIYTHAFAGVGIASLLTPRPRPLLYWSLAALLPVLPDFDTFWIAPYGSTLGHRGFTHSVGFALCVGLIAAAASYRYLQMRFWLLFALFTLITASHGILDAFTNGGYGIPFLWPFSDRRWGPYGPIKVADIALDVPDPRKSRAIQTELLYVWLPLGTAVVGMQAYRWLVSRRVSARTKSSD
jgi:inner membrane protein